jgi:hypothetical protein
MGFIVTAPNIMDAALYVNNIMKLFTRPVYRLLCNLLQAFTFILQGIARVALLFLGYSAGGPVAIRETEVIRFRAD